MQEVTVIHQFTGKQSIERTPKEGCILGEMLLVKEESQGLLSGYSVLRNLQHILWGGDCHGWL